MPDARARNEYDVVGDFASDGVACVRSAFDAGWVEALRVATSDVMDNPRPSSSVAGTPGSGRFFTDTNMWLDHSVFREIAFNSPAPGIAASLMGSSKINLYNEHLLVKEPNSPDSPTPWHQDQPYFRTQGRQICSIWIAMDRVTLASGVMRFVKGSHNWNKMFQPVRFTSSDPADAEDFDGLAPVDLDDNSEYSIIHYDLEPGDCTVHHGLTLHAAFGNKSNSSSRRGLSLRYAGDDITYIERKWHPTDAKVDLKNGDPLDCHLYPVVWWRNQNIINGRVS